MENELQVGDLVFSKGTRLSTGVLIRGIFLIKKITIIDDAAPPEIFFDRDIWEKSWWRTGNTVRLTDTSPYLEKITWKKGKR